MTTAGVIAGATVLLATVPWVVWEVVCWRRTWKARRRAQRRARGRGGVLFR